MRTYVKGIDEAITALNREVQKIEGRTLRGLIRGAVIIRRKIDTVPPVVPVDLGNLRASWFSVTTNSVRAGKSPKFKGPKATEFADHHSAVVNEMQGKVKGEIAVAMGFSANYAAEVHEKIEAKFRRPDSGAKFFQAAINNSIDEVLEIVRKEATR